MTDAHEPDHRAASTVRHRVIYDALAASYGQTRNLRFDVFKDTAVEDFCTEVGVEGGRILDIGSGPGRESLRFQTLGLTPLCIDISPRMVTACHSVGLEARCIDVRELRYDREFAGAWSSYALLHLEKGDLPAALAAIATALVPGAPFYLMLFEGEGEGIPRYKRNGIFEQRYFSYYTADELAHLLSLRFDLNRVDRLEISPRPSLLMRTTRKG